MYLSKESAEALTVKNAKRANVAYNTLRAYVSGSVCDRIDAGPRIKNDLEPGTYAKHVRIVSSGNEPRIYAFVEDEKGEMLYCADTLRTDPEAYADCARACGAFLEAFNLYCHYNDI